MVDLQSVKFEEQFLTPRCRLAHTHTRGTFVAVSDSHVKRIGFRSSVRVGDAMRNCRTCIYGELAWHDSVGMDGHRCRHRPRLPNCPNHFREHRKPSMGENSKNKALLTSHTRGPIHSTLLRLHQEIVQWLTGVDPQNHISLLRGFTYIRIHYTQDAECVQPQCRPQPQEESFHRFVTTDKLSFTLEA